MFEVAYYALEQCSKILPSYLLHIAKEQLSKGIFMIIYHNNYV